MGGHPVGPGDTVGRYAVLHRLGEGGMGVVFAAYDPELKRKIALKLLRPRGRSAERLQRGRDRMLDEAKALARLSHPNVVEVHHFGEHMGNVYLAMELIDGRTLTQWLGDEERSRAEIIDVFRQAGEGLAAAHQAGIVHRDFKPDNVMLGPSGRVFVMDFGLALSKTTDSSMASMGSGDIDPHKSIREPTQASTVGTPAYMAPEQQVRGEADAPADQFSYCVAMYEALSGHHPFQAETSDGLAANIIEGRLVPPSVGRRIPSWLRAALLRGLAPAPDERWKSMRALLDALARDPGVARRRVAGSVAFLGTAALVAVLTTRGAAVEAVCSGGEVRLDGVWDEPRRAAIATAFAATDEPYAGDTARTVERLLDAYAQRWLSAYVEACEATHLRAQQTEHMLDLRMRCLDRRLTQVSALVDVFGAADSDVVERAVAAVGRLDRVESCADVTGLTAAVPPPADATTAKEVDRIRAAIAQALARESAGLYMDGLEIARSAAEAASKSDYAPVHAEALHCLGSLQRQVGQFDSGEESLTHAFLLAQESGDDALAARTAVDLVFCVGYNQARHEDGMVWARHAEALIKRVPDSDEIAAHLHNSLGVVLWKQRRFEASRREHEQALELRRKSSTEASTAIAVSEFNIGDVLVAQGRHVEAREYFTRAITTYHALVGRDHPMVAYCLQGMGEAWIGESEHDRAIESFERALAIRERSRARPGLIAKSRWGLALALWDATGEPEDAERMRARALSLAILARDGFETAGAVREAELQQVRAWLQARQTTTE